MTRNKESYGGCKKSLIYSTYTFNTISSRTAAYTMAPALPGKHVVFGHARHTLCFRAGKEVRPTALLTGVVEAVAHQPHAGESANPVDVWRRDAAARFLNKECAGGNVLFRQL